MEKIEPFVVSFAITKYRTMNTYIKNHGLILRIDKENQIYTILDQEKGKILCRLKRTNPNYFTGLFISYFIKTEKRFFKISEVETLAHCAFSETARMVRPSLRQGSGGQAQPLAPSLPKGHHERPFALDPWKGASESLQKLQFLHQLLEISYYFLPEESPSHEVFIFLRNIILCNKEFSKVYQKIIICKLLALMGIIPEYSFKEAYLNLIMSFPIDSLIELEINLDMEKYLDKWIIEGIKSHPNVGKFNTVRFFEF